MKLPRILLTLRILMMRAWYRLPIARRWGRGGRGLAGVREPRRPRPPFRPPQAQRAEPEPWFEARPAATTTLDHPRTRRPRWPRRSPGAA